MLASQFAVQTKATVYIEDENGTILYSSDELQTTTDQDSIATIQESTDTIIVMMSTRCGWNRKRKHFRKWQMSIQGLKPAKELSCGHKN